MLLDDCIEFVSISRKKFLLYHCVNLATKKVGTEHVHLLIPQTWIYSHPRVEIYWLMVVLDSGADCTQTSIEDQTYGWYPLNGTRRSCGREHTFIDHPVLTYLT